MDKGWIKVHRQILSNPMWQNDPTAMHLFMSLLLVVNAADGTYLTGRYMLSDLTGVKPMTIYKALLRLELTEMVTLTSNNKYTVVTICNWKKYQGTSNTSSNNKVTTKEHQSNIKVTLNKNKELRIKNKTTNVVLGEPAKTGNDDINKMFEYWQEKTDQPISAMVKANRFACSNLIRKHGIKNLKRIVDGVAQARGDQYAPRIANFVQLQRKFDELMVWGRQNNKSNVEIIS